MSLYRKKIGDASRNSLTFRVSKRILLIENDSHFRLKLFHMEESK
ncbi:hypothetical protein HMPREF9515_01944 [Enterococcus faecalis TX0860]|nr:hypothetical protein HMPREF9515_01944 [Enterococcus faecalis TX0860]